MARLRISGGELRGRPLASPSSGLRPTTGRVREAIFSILGDVAGLRVMDLFCGTGALAAEALSRGAREAVLVDVETGPASVNVEALGVASRVSLVRSDAAAYLDRAPEGAFDLVLCDPPYGLDERSWTRLDPLIRRALAPGGRVMVESAREEPARIALPLLRERRYGDTVVRVHGAAGAES